jgi:CRP-like cAMP-binding protein
LQLDPSAFVADPVLLQALEKRATPIICSEDRVLFRQGDDPVGLYIIQKGEASVSMNPGNGGAIFSCEAAAGSLLGLPGLIGKQPYSLTAIAHRGAVVSYVTTSLFEALMKSEPALLLKVLQVLANEVRSARLAITQF